MTSPIEEFAALRGYFTTMHHTPGRLRLSINRRIIQNESGMTLKEIEALPLHVKGLREIKLNKIAATATILYDPLLIEPALFDALLRGERLDEMKARLNLTPKEYA